ncbi:MAG: PKD domain-containing protein, partial [Verrucomicrobia bacterium]|nr:PKD domain-containing protein [Verrucomicrobiota bacterium]
MNQQLQCAKSQTVFLAIVLVIDVAAGAPLLAQTPLYAHTQPANAIRATNAKLNGMVLPGSNPATAWFEWGTNSSCGNVAGLTNLPAGDRVVALRCGVEGLSSDFVYHCRLVASNIAGVAYGADHQFTLGGTVSVWGNPNFGHTIVPADLTNAVAVSGGADHCAALRSDGSIAAWGGNYYGQRDVPPDLGEAIAVSLGEYHSLALLADGTVRAWGAGLTLVPAWPEGGQSIVPDGLSDVIQIAAGTTHNLALKSDGTVAAWGSARLYADVWNDLGQSQVPPGLSNVVAVAGGDFHSMALKIDGTVVVWGYNTHGQGDVPPGLTNVVAVAAGWYHNFALKPDGTLIAWGLGMSDGGFPYFGQARVPAGLTDVAGMAGGGFYSLAHRTDGTAAVWGRDDYGQVSQANGLSNVVALAGGYDFGLALHKAGVGLPPLPSTRYVDVGNAHPTPPYTNWATAATTIQDAVDAARVGDAILVTNGIYQTGASTWANYADTNRVTVTKAVAIRSVNGPEVTLIGGYRGPGPVSYLNSVRCVYLTADASLSGFTLTNGGASSGGGVECASATAIVSNCVLTGNSAGGSGGGAVGGTLNKCTLMGNSAQSGGGAYGSTLNNCTLTRNSVTALDWGSGTGGGADSSTLNNCTVEGNSADLGGGASWSTINNCTVFGNSALDAGGVFGSTLTNCILFYNNAAKTFPNYDIPDSTLDHCCTTPLPANGVGNIDAEPQLASASHLSTNSPCRGRGTYAAVSGVDIDGDPWANPPSMGCDELRNGPVVGALTLAVLASYTNVAAGFSVDFQAGISGPVTASRWEFGDGTVISNRPYAAHAWSAAGDYAVVLRAYNDSYPAGVTATVRVHIATQPVHYVAANNLTPSAPYASWATAATNIQDAVDAAAVPGSLILVTNGIYATGGRAVFGSMTNRVAVDKLVTLRSVNGPQFTTIKGYQVPGVTNGDGAIRCVYLTNGAALSGFTLTNGATLSCCDSEKEQSGGGVWCDSSLAVVSNCVLTGNSAGSQGGGASSGTLLNCTLAGNSASQGGGAYAATLNNCTLVGNSAQNGGAAYLGALEECALSMNSASSVGGGAYSATLHDCTLAGNVAVNGGGASSSTLNNCTLIDNEASFYAGGADGSTLTFCTLAGNQGQYGGGAANGPLHNCVLANNLGFYGGGAYNGTLNNCVLMDNLAQYGGGADGGTLNDCTLTGNLAVAGGGLNYVMATNCIVYYNTAANGANYAGGTLNYCCTTPLAPGLGNLTDEPQLASLSHLSAGSPCRGRGSAAYASGVDIDGEPWANPPSIGCDEYRSGLVTGALSAAIVASFTSVAVGTSVDFQAVIEGRVSASVWHFGDGVVVSNRPWAAHAWLAAGDYVVELRAYNESNPAGVAASVTVHVGAQPVHYVARNSSNPVPPYSSWATAATRIQDAVD